MGGEGGGGENPCLRVESEELRVEMWCVRLRGHFFLVRGRGGASPAPDCRKSNWEQCGLPVGL